VIATSHGDGAGAGGAALTAISAAMAVEEANLTATANEKINLFIIRPFSPPVRRRRLRQTGYRRTHPRAAQARRGLEVIFLLFCCGAKMKDTANADFLCA
jgi:hypothetical protein